MPSRSAGERLTATCRIRGRKPLFFVVAKRLLICGQAQPHPSGLIFQISDALEKRFPSANLRHDENPLFSAIFEHPEGGSMLSGSGASTNRRWAPADPEDRVAAAGRIPGLRPRGSGVLLFENGQGGRIAPRSVREAFRDAGDRRCRRAGDLLDRRV